MYLLRELNKRRRQRVLKFVSLPSRRAESLGYSTVLVPDHLGTLAPFPPLIAAADATHRLRVGTFVLNNDFHNPWLLAREVATTDLLTGGRLELGIGAGHMKAEYDTAGLRFEAGPARVARLAESVGIVSRLLADEGHLSIAVASFGEIVDDLIASGPRTSGQHT